MYKRFEDVVDKIEDEGLEYFLLEYSRPSEISRKADEKCLKFKKIWERILPDLEELQKLIIDSQNLDTTDIDD